MPDLKIKNVDAAVIRRLDEVVAQKQLADRSELVRGILSQYLAFGDAFYARELPDTVQILIRDALAEYPGKLEKILEYALSLMRENNDLLRRMDRVFDGETDEVGS
jgi:hypothetical protein